MLQMVVRIHQQVPLNRKLQLHLKMVIKIIRNPQIHRLRCPKRLLHIFSYLSPFLRISIQESSIKSSSSPQSTSSTLQHQSKSFPPRHLQRTSSISSEVSQLFLSDNSFKPSIAIKDSPSSHAQDTASNEDFTKYVL